MHQLFYLFLFLFLAVSRVGAQSAGDFLVSPPPDSTPSADIIIQLSEVMSCPHTNEGEWIEIYNNSSTSWEMEGWKIKNIKNISRHLDSQTIQPHSFAVLNFSSGLLNNDGDTFSLENAASTTIFTATIPACQTKGTSFIFDGTTWLETTLPTPAESNSFPAASTSASVAAGANYSTTISNSSAHSPSSSSSSASASSSSSAPIFSAPASFRYSTLNLAALSNFSALALPTSATSSSSDFSSPSASLSSSSPPSPSSHSSVIIIGAILTFLGGASAAYLFYVKKIPLLPHQKPVSAWEEHSDSLDVL